MWKYFHVEQEPALSKDPVLLISLSTANPQFLILYSQARELANFLLEKVEFKRFASLYSSALLAGVSVSDGGVADLVSVNFYHARSRSRDVILLAGYGSPTSDEYEFGSEILSFAKKLGVSEVISIGARWGEEPLPPLDEPKVLGFSTDDEGTAWLEKNGVTILKSEAAYFFANTVIGMCPAFGLRGCKLSVNHGEPRPHPKSLMALLDVLKKKLDLTLDTSSLESKATELAEVIRTSGLDKSGIEAGAADMQGKQGDIYR